MLRSLGHRLRWMRFLLLWPAVTAYRRRANRSLRWRLAGYNLLTLIAGLATAFILVGILAAVGANARRYAEEEPADDARAVAEFLVAAGLLRLDHAPNPGTLEPVLRALVSGDVPIYAGPERDQFDVRPERYLQGVAGITIRGRAVESWEIATGDIEPGTDFSTILPGAYEGETDLRAASRVEGDSGIGAFPVFDADGATARVVIVEKHDIQAPQGWAILRAQIRPVVTTVWVGSVVAALPGLAVAVLLAVAAARSVGGRIRSVSFAAEALASGDLSSRAPESGQDEVASLSRSFNAMAEQLQSTMGSLEAERERAVGLLDANRQLVANVSHELRTPVALIRGQVEALEEDEPGNARIEMALRETGRLEQLVSDLFQLASAEAGAVPFDLQRLDLRDVAREAAAPLVETAWRESQVRLVVESGDAGVSANVDGSRLTRVVQNLLRNAVRHTPEGGLVRVAVFETEEAAAISVADTGPGIPEADLPHVFERFYRGDASRARDTGGAGLGLAIAKEFVEAMGGTISVESPPGEGATFTIRFRLNSPSPAESGEGVGG